MRSVTRVVALLAVGHLALGVVAAPDTHSTAGDAFVATATAGWVVRLALVTGATLCFVLGPGLLLRRRTTASLLTNLAFAWVPGFVWLTVVGVVAWLLAFAVDPQFVSVVLLFPIPVLLLWSTRPGTADLADHHEQRAVVLALLTLAIGIGVASWSRGVDGELYAGTVSRTLEADARSDSRISYNVVQLVAHGDAPYSDVGESYYSPYNFYARGPIAGLAAAPVVLSGGAAPPRAEPPDQPWEPFDAQGFAGYRIVMMMLNATAVLGAFGLLRLVVRPRAALAGAALVAMCPFVVAEVYFTWPKLLAASFVVTALVALVLRRPLVAGLLVGAGYLAHPSALFAAPAVALVWLVLLQRGMPGLCTAERARRTSLAQWFRGLAWLAGGALIVYGTWYLANRGHTTDYFTSYLRSVPNNADPSIGDWIGSRVHSLANTLIPGRLVIFDSDDFFINAIGGGSAGIVRASHLYRATLPFAVGILYFPLFLYGVARFARRNALLFLAAIALPLLAFVVYWGANTTGVLREGMHAILLFAVIAAFLGHSATGAGATAAALVRTTATLRAVEVLFMAVGDTVATNGILGAGLVTPTDVLSLSLVLAGVGGLAALTWRWFEPSVLMASSTLEARPRP